MGNRAGGSCMRPIGLAREKRSGGVKWKWISYIKGGFSPGAVQNSASNLADIWTYARTTLAVALARTHTHTGSIRGARHEAPGMYILLWHSFFSLIFFYSLSSFAYYILFHARSRHFRFFYIIISFFFSSSASYTEMWENSFVSRWIFIQWKVYLNFYVTSSKND